MLRRASPVGGLQTIRAIRGSDGPWPSGCEGHIRPTSPIQRTQLAGTVSGPDTAGGRWVEAKVLEIRKKTLVCEFLRELPQELLSYKDNWITQQ